MRSQQQDSEPTSPPQHDDEQHGTSAHVWSDASQELSVSSLQEDLPMSSSNEAAHHPDAVAPPMSPSRDDVMGEDLSNGALLPMSPFAMSSASELPPLPQREEPTLKEKLVERERQARVETERARLKRQFVLNSNGGEAAREDGNTILDDAHTDDLQDASVKEGHGSLVGTLGEGSSVAAAPTDVNGEVDADDAAANEKLGYAMERFLSEQPTEADMEGSVQQEPIEPKKGVVMERFLAEPVVVDPPPVRAATEEEHSGHESTYSLDDSKMPARDDGHLDVLLEQVGNSHRNLPVTDSMEVNADTLTLDGSDLQATIGSIRSYSTVSNDGASTADQTLEGLRNMEVLPTTTEDEVLAIDAHTAPSDTGTEELASPVPTESSLPESTDQSHFNNSRRVFRLTEAEIQEMAAIEEASIGNAPPSEREESFSESSLVGDMIREFDASGHEALGTFSVGTRTTALESASSMGGDAAGRLSDYVPEENSVDTVETVSASSHMNLSPTPSHDAASVTAMPPSDIAHDEPPPSLILDDQLGVAQSHSGPHGEGVFSGGIAPVGVAPSFEDSMGNLDAEACAAANAGVANRTLRPGRSPERFPSVPPQMSDRSGRATSLPARLLNDQIDDFDFDKHWEGTPKSTGQDSLNDLPSPMWSPATASLLSPSRNDDMPPDLESPGRVQLREQLQCPALDAANAARAPESAPHAKADLKMPQNYGATAVAAANIRSTFQERGFSDRHMSIEFGEKEEERQRDETQPLFHRGHVHRGHEAMGGDQIGVHQDLFNAFDEAKTDSTVDSHVEDCEKYLTSTVLERAFPERMFALIVTLIVEIPVVLMVSGGSDRLCQLIGRRKYMLLMGFLPLSSAISGNVGLQASTLTTRAISHFHVTVESYPAWLQSEVAAAGFLGAAMGLLIGFCGFAASGFDLAFGFTIFMAQFVSILTAGLTGTLAPLIFTFIFRRDSGKWGGPLETAVQDIVGSFAMVVMSYHLLLLLPQQEVSPDDFCGLVEASSDD